MPEERVLVVGLGEVGLPLYELLKESKHFDVYGYDIDQAKMRRIGQAALPKTIDIMHICIPCFNLDEFVNTASSYVERFRPKLVIINSTVPAGTTMEVYKSCGRCLIAHSPIRGVHESLESMKRDIKSWTKYVGGANAEAGKAASRHFRKVGLKTKSMKSCAETEVAKLFETTYRAWMIACFQEMHRIARACGASFDDVAEFLEDTHRVRLDRPLMFPDIISGHCVIPNVKLLLQGYDSKFLHLILESNEKRKEEIKDKSVYEQVQRVRKRADALQAELMKKMGKHDLPVIH